ncbi:uncharacterized protein ARMOST_17618 [Armillaria ostoyae]|uniref:Glucose-methanol-choline oxidoreductase N-terminal domain-containing protein n=1 Tax=Armillaria ostoyae TaxID=47428 RepID=A0A284RZG8_ARMOS|nr:uncharacterized protein ARMOST_17618 [Armillaria ostoyae]
MSDFVQNERFVASADHHNTTGQYDPAVHGFEGITSVSIAEYPSVIDGRIIQATKELSDEFPFNMDYNSGYHLGIGWHQKTIGNGTRSSSEASYLGPEYIDRANLYVLVDSHVTRILVENGSTVDQNSEPYFDSVEFTQDAGSRPVPTMHTLSARKEIILSAGVIGTPHILLNSGVGHANELSVLGITPTVHLPDVGKNLRDQVSMMLTWTVNDTQMVECLYWRNETFREEALTEWQLNRTGFLANPPSNHLGFFRLGDELMDEESCAGNQTGHYELVFTGGMDTLPVPATGNYFTALVNIFIGGNITINSTNPLSPPVINPNILSNEQDLVFGGAQRFAAAPVWADYILELYTDLGDLEGSIRNQARPAGHSVGTASMSPRNAHWGVVDPDLRLKRARGSFPAYQIIDETEKFVLPSPRQPELSLKIETRISFLMDTSFPACGRSEVPASTTVSGIFKVSSESIANLVAPRCRRRVYISARLGRIALLHNAAWSVCELKNYGVWFCSPVDVRQGCAIRSGVFSLEDLEKYIGAVFADT